ncbi:MAG: hypothetical protein CME06_14995 [Gemmatimonadetes bacterium]|nr:hypothetical protein [Gemmatimonadota bacterium]
MFELLIVLILVYGGFRLFTAIRRVDRGPEKCAGCRHNLRSDSEGTVCGLGGTRLFKTRIQVSWCQNRE